LGSLLGKRTALKLPKPPKAILKLEDWLKTHKASEIEEAALLLGLAGLSFKTFGVGEETVTETYIDHYREDVIFDYGETVGEQLGIRGMFFRQPMFREIIGSHIVRTPIYATREVKKKVYHPEAALAGPIALKLAQTDGLISQGVGTAYLALLGVANVLPDFIELKPDPKLNLRLMGSFKLPK
jgi:hypothetical protein